MRLAVMKNMQLKEGTTTTETRRHGIGFTGTLGSMFESIHLPY
jgi:hypothetical protein